jgi:signal transduction histidine kinase
MRGSSLALRLFALAAIWSALSLAVAGFVLITVYRGAMLRSFDDHITVLVKTLVGSVDDNVHDGDLKQVANDDFGEIRFRTPLSGWYWVVRNAADGKVAVTSPSLSGETLILPSDVGVEPGADHVWRGFVMGPDDHYLRIIERELTFDEGPAFRIAVAGDAGELEDDIIAFATRTALLLALVGFGLVATTFLQVRLALAPLRRMGRALFAIRAGEASRLEGRFPVEISPLANELNALIDANRETTERARTHVGNLAHALKTPLSVITNEARAADPAFGGRIAEQAALMREHIDHHLERARMAAQRRVIGVVTDVVPIVERLARAMRKIHEAKGVTVTVDMTGQPKFRGERQDLEEALGNLMDNACKWCKGKVAVTVRLDAAAHEDKRQVIFLIDDDGPGLSPGERQQALERGKRLDETVPGTGLGLSIVVELARLYGGRFELDHAPLGGLRCRFILPAL